MGQDILLRAGAAWTQKGPPANERPQGRRQAPYRPRPGAGLRGLDGVDRDLAAAPIFGDVERDLLAFGEAAQSGALERGGVDEHVLAAIVRLDESEALHLVVELNGTRHHGEIPSLHGCT